MDKINYIIFSKDRACQLDLLLRSIDRFCNNYVNCYVIYKATTPEYQAGYSKLINNTPNYLCLKSILPENDFRTDTIKTVFNNPSYLFGFLTDDTVFYKEMPYSPNQLYKLMESEQCFSFSFRNGCNTELQCHYQPIYERLDYKTISLYNDVIIWDTSKYSFGIDFGRPMSIDGNIFDYNALINTLVEFTFKCPRTLDGISTKYLGPKMMAFKESVVVNIPWNLTAGGHADNWGHFHSYSLDELNIKWLEGKSISLEKLDLSHIISSHQEREIVFEC